MKLKEFGPPGGGARPKFYYVDPPLGTGLAVANPKWGCGRDPETCNLRYPSLLYRRSKFLQDKGEGMTQDKQIFFGMTQLHHSR